MSIIENLFNTFHDTIVLKEDSNLEKQLDELKKIKPNAKKDICLLERGIKGENNILFELKNANLGLYVLRDITINHEDNRFQIDFIIISKGYIYLVECKNLIGNIYVDNKGQFQRQYEYNGKTIKEAIYSPYAQALRHKELLKKRWYSKANAFEKIFHSDSFDDLWYKPLVVIANPKSIVNTRFAPKEIKESVVRIDQLVDYIRKDLNNYSGSFFFNKKEMEKNAKIFLEINTNEFVSIADKYKDEVILKEKLLEYRKEKSLKRKIPLDFIFSDEELEIIINIKPKNSVELNNILNDIKVKYHGKEILDIINNVK